MFLGWLRPSNAPTAGTHDKADPRDNHAADCQVCGKQMVSTNRSSSIPCYEVIRMPDGTNAAVPCDHKHLSKVGSYHLDRIRMKFPRTSV
jgi:hypothetical protein